MTDVVQAPMGHKGPRAEVLLALKESRELTARDLTARLGLSLNAVRHHLRELESDGVVEHVREHRGVGAPSFAYRLTNRGHSLFPRRYLETLQGILAVVEEREGREAAVRMLETHFDVLSQELEARVRDVPADARPDVVAEVLAHEGYMSEWRATGPECGTLLERNCAIQAVAERYPEICAAEQRFLEKVLAAAVNRKAHILGGCSVCEYHVQFEADRSSVPVQIGTRQARPGEHA